MALPLEGKAALVTGASKGIGKGIALELARQGCNVAVNYNSDKQGAEQTVQEIQAMGRMAIAVVGDVGKSAAVQAMFQQVLATFPTLFILVNNSGTQVASSLLDLREEDWDKVINTNLKGCFLCTQQAGRHMKEHGGGRIINIGSGCNKLGFPDLVSYTASKGGIEMFTKVAAAELGQYNITVNCVAPGSIEIERTQQEAAGYAESWSKLTPLGRIGKPLDVGRAVAFFCSEQADFVSGQTLWVDGGLFSKAFFPYDQKSAPPPQ